MAPGRAARVGLWLLPVYGVLLGLSTLSHQPPISDFDAYARYITTGVFLASHLGASILGAALAVLGVVAVVGYLVARGPARLAVTGLVLTTLAQIYLSAAFGSAAFVQPGIGRAYLAGVQGMPELNTDTAYGPALVATAGGATLLFVAAAIALGVAIARAHRRLRAVGVAYAGWPAVRAFRLPAAGRAVCGGIRRGGRDRGTGRSVAARSWFGCFPRAGGH